MSEIIKNKGDKGKEKRIANHTDHNLRIKFLKCGLNRYGMRGKRGKREQWLEVISVQMDLKEFQRPRGQKRETSQKEKRLDLERDLERLNEMERP